MAGIFYDDDDIVETIWIGRVCIKNIALKRYGIGIRCFFFECIEFIQA